VLEARPLGEQIPFAGDPQEQRIAPQPRFGKRARLQGPSHPAFAMVKVNRVMNPPGAVVAPEMMAVVAMIDAQ
jgi:hypothetical protein